MSVAERGGADAVTLAPPRTAARAEDAGFRWPEDRRPEQPAPAPSPTWQDWVRRAVLTLGLAGAVWVYAAPPTAGLPLAGQRSIAIFLLCTTLWITNAIPVGVTGLLAVALLGLCEVM